MPSVTPDDVAIEVFGGVDTHQDTHTAAAIDQAGRVLGRREPLGGMVGGRGLVLVPESNRLGGRGGRILGTVAGKMLSRWRMWTLRGRGQTSWSPRALRSSRPRSCRGRLRRRRGGCGRSMTSFAARKCYNDDACLIDFRDARRLKDVAIPQERIVKGDAKSLSIAIRTSARANWKPRQKCTPVPNAR